MTIKIAPSILSADFAVFGAEIRDVLAGGADWIHFDVMDGVFVPNINLGVSELKCAARAVPAFYDVHLMITDPARYIDAFAAAGANAISFHLEAQSDVRATIEKIRGHAGVLAGIVLKPGTPASAAFEYLPLVDYVLVMTVEPGFGGQKFMADMCGKIEALRAEMRRIGKPDMPLEVDGGIDPQTAPLAVRAGANLLVAGSSVFGCADRAAAIAAIRAAAQ